jgi:hypothetical protein
MALPFFVLFTHRLADRLHEVSPFWMSTCMDPQRAPKNAHLFMTVRVRTPGCAS